MLSDKPTNREAKSDCCCDEKISTLENANHLLEIVRGAYGEVFGTDLNNIEGLAVNEYEARLIARHWIDKVTDFEYRHFLGLSLSSDFAHYLVALARLAIME